VLPARRGHPPARPAARRRACGGCWTGAAACGRVEPLGCPGGTAAGQAPGQGWRGAYHQVHRSLLTRICHQSQTRVPGGSARRRGAGRRPVAETGKCYQRSEVRCLVHIQETSLGM
jgi:hypothetical protein